MGERFEFAIVGAGIAGASLAAGLAGHGRVEAARLIGLGQVPCVGLPVGEPSKYRLRSEAHPSGLSTLEAIARALRVLGGDAGPEVERALLVLQRAMMERTLWSRGSITLDDVSDGVLPGTRRDVPR